MSSLGTLPSPWLSNGPATFTFSAPTSPPDVTLEREVELARLDLLAAGERVLQQLVDVGARIGLVAAATAAAAGHQAGGEEGDEQGEEGA